MTVICKPLKMGQQADVVWVGNPHPAVVTGSGHSRGVLHPLKQANAFKLWPLIVRHIINFNITQEAASPSRAKLYDGGELQGDCHSRAAEDGAAG